MCCRKVRPASTEDAFFVEQDDSPAGFSRPGSAEDAFFVEQDDSPAGFSRPGSAEDAFFVEQDDSPAGFSRPGSTEDAFLFCGTTFSALMIPTLSGPRRGVLFLGARTHLINESPGKTRMLQGLKPTFPEAFSARLKPCPPKEPFMRRLLGPSAVLLGSLASPSAGRIRNPKDAVLKHGATQLFSVVPVLHLCALCVKSGLFSFC